MPYFPYSRQSKKKQHRGAITARMIANLLHIAGVNHVITLDLHASQMQGFFKCPVDNLVAEPLLSRWIRMNVPNWREAVVVSKNPGGTKRVTSLADAMKLSFGIVTTDRRRAGGSRPWNESAMFEQLRLDGPTDAQEPIAAALDADAEITPISKITLDTKADVGKPKMSRAQANLLQRRTTGKAESSPLQNSMRASSIVEPEIPLEPLRKEASGLQEVETVEADDEMNGEENGEVNGKENEEESGAEEEYTDEVSIPRTATPSFTDLLSVHETLFTGVLYKVTLSTTHIRRHPCPQPRTARGATDPRPRARTMTFPLT
jgi:ribose-phosphate pyrophosphokinase